MTKPIRLADFDALTFDVYGTLIDWEPTLSRFLSEQARAHGIDEAPEATMARYDAIRGEVQRRHPALLYPEILRRCFDALHAQWGVTPAPESRERFAEGPKTWPAYPDSSAALKALQARARIAALSNIDEASLAVSCQKLDIRFDLTVTAERVRDYKPAMPHFKTGLAELAAMGIARQRVLHVAQSLRADIAPANALGLSCVWVNRQGRQLGLTGQGAAAAKPDLTVASMAELVERIA